MPRTIGRPIRSAGATRVKPARGPIYVISFLAGEMTGKTLNTLHNLNFYLDTLGRIREAIEFGQFENFRRAFCRPVTEEPE
jgi:tRNA-guanine family transglycosylase